MGLLDPYHREVRHLGCHTFPHFTSFVDLHVAFTIPCEEPKVVLYCVVFHRLLRTINNVRVKIKYQKK